MNREVITDLALTGTEQHQAFKDIRGYVKESVISMARNVKKRFQNDHGLHRRIIGNPYSSLSRKTVIEELGITMPQEEAVRAIVLAEPEAEYDRVFKSLTEKEKQELMKSQLESTVNASRRFISYVLSSDKKVIDKSNEELYSELSRRVFETDDPDLIDKNFSQQQRRRIRLALVNLIQDMQRMRPYLDKFKEKPKETAAEVLKRNQFSGDIEVKVNPLGIVIKAFEEDYAVMRNIKVTDVFGHCGVKLWIKSPREISGRVILINKGGKNTGAVYSPEEIAATERHEWKHIAFVYFFQQEDVPVIENIKESFNKASDQQDIERHHLQAEQLRKWFMEFARDELISWSGQKNYYFLWPSQLVDAYDMRWYLDLAVKCLAENNNLSPEQKRDIYLIYRNKYQEYLHQVREAHWIAHKLNKRKVQEQAEALMQNISVDEFDKAEKYIGIENDKISAQTEKVMGRHVKRVSQSVDRIIGEGKAEDYTAWIPDFKLDSHFGAIMAYYPMDALPVLLKIVRYSSNNLLLKRSMLTLQYILEACGGVIPPEMSVSTAEVRKAVEDMQEKRKGKDFDSSRNCGKILIYATDILEKVNAGKF